jgi:hypothetical protein
MSLLRRRFAIIISIIAVFGSMVLITFSRDYISIFVLISFSFGSDIMIIIYLRLVSIGCSLFYMNAVGIKGEEDVTI